MHKMASALLSRERWTDLTRSRRKSEQMSGTISRCRSHKPQRVDHSDDVPVVAMRAIKQEQRVTPLGGDSDRLSSCLANQVQSVMALEITNEAQAAGGNSAAGQQARHAAADL